METSLRHSLQGYVGTFPVLPLFGHPRDVALTASWHRIVAAGAQRSASAQSSHSHPAAVDEAILAYGFVSIF